MSHGMQNKSKSILRTMSYHISEVSRRIKLAFIAVVKKPMSKCGLYKNVGILVFLKSK